MLRLSISAISFSLIFSACSNMETVKGTEDVVGLAQKAMNAYQSGEATEWGKLVCNAASSKSPLAGWDNMRYLVGDISNIRLVSGPAPITAGNKVYKNSSRAEFQVTASNYYRKELVLTFLISERTDCVRLHY